MRDPGLIPGSGRSSGEGNGYPFQCSCLENFMERGTWWAIVLVTPWLRGFHFHFWVSPVHANVMLNFGASLVAQLVKNLPAMRGPGFDPWVGKIPWRRERLPLQYSGLENSMDCIAHWAEKSHTRLSSFHFHFHISATSFTVWLNPDWYTSHVVDALPCHPLFFCNYFMFFIQYRINIQILALSLSGSTNLGKLLELPDSQLLHL